MGKIKLRFRNHTILTEGMNIRLTDEVIKEVNFPAEYADGVIIKHTPEKKGALIRHSNGEVYAWSYTEFTVLSE